MGRRKESFQADETDKDKIQRYNEHNRHRKFYPRPAHGRHSETIHWRGKKRKENGSEAGVEEEREREEKLNWELRCLQKRKCVLGVKGNKAGKIERKKGRALTKVSTRSPGVIGKMEVAGHSWVLWKSM